MRYETTKQPDGLWYFTRGGVIVSVATDMATCYAKALGRLMVVAEYAENDRDRYKAELLKQVQT